MLTNWQLRPNGKYNVNGYRPFCPRRSILACIFWFGVTRQSCTIVKSWNFGKTCQHNITASLFKLSSWDTQRTVFNVLIFYKIIFKKASTRFLWFTIYTSFLDRLTGIVGSYLKVLQCTCKFSSKILRQTNNDARDTANDRARWRQLVAQCSDQNGTN